MKRKFMSLALVLLMLVSMGTTTASAEDSAAMYRNEASQISREALDAVMQKYVPANTINTTENGVVDELSEEEISELFSAQGFALLSGDEEEYERIDRELENHGYYTISQEDLATLLGGDPNALPLSYGPPQKPNDTKYVIFKLNPGVTPGGYNYVNIIASSTYVPESGVYQAESLALYNCQTLNIYPSRTDYTSAILKEAIQLLADEATSKLKTVPGILASKFTGILIEKFFHTGQSFGASAYVATGQTVVYSYLEDVPGYYTHYVTAEQCNMLVVYYFAYNNGSGPETAMSTSRVSFTAKNFSSPQKKAEENIKNYLYIRDGYTCGKIQLTYPTIEGGKKTTTIARTIYSELDYIPGVF